MCFSITMGRSAIGAEQLLFASSERPSTKEKSSQNHGCTNRFCANKKMLARQSRYVPPCTCGKQIFKKMPRAGPASTPLSPPQFPPEMASRPALWASAGAPVLAIPKPQNRTPPPSKIGSRRTRKPKIREQFSVPFSGPFSGPRTGSVFRIQNSNLARRFHNSLFDFSVSRR